MNIGVEGLIMQKEENFKALERFIAEAKKEFRKKDFKGLKVSLEQAKGRIHNLLILLEEELKDAI